VIRILIFLVFVTASYWFNAPAPADQAKCTSLQARCAVQAGGTCDPQTGHWCYGRYQGKECGGTGAAFRECLVRNHPAEEGASATAPTGLGKCTSIQARCAIEIGGICNPSTGNWRYGPVYFHHYGGNTAAFLACLDRARDTQK